MATINPVVTSVGVGNGACKKVQWTPVTSSDVCEAVALPDLTDRSIQVAGTFDSASVALHGSNDGTNFAALNIPAGTAIAITAAGIKAVLENTVLTKPVISGGGGSQSLTITMLFHLSQALRA